MTSKTGKSSDCVTTTSPTASATKASATSADPHPSSPSPKKEDCMRPDELVGLDFNRFDYIRFTFADINGISRSKMVSKRGFAQQVKDGVFLFAGNQ